jgi:hypothetical protein
MKVLGVCDSEIRSDRDIPDIQDAARGTVAFEDRDHAVADIRDAPQRVE